ncbi:MAG: glycosyltransferase family 2 protein [Christensenellaceae bacterium]
MRLLVFIPAYNEEKSIKKVVDNLVLKCPQYDYVIINDGSTDRTEQICAENGFACISLPINLGLDGVFQTGNKYAYLHGYDLAIPFDGDGQHNAEYIPLLVDKMNEGYDIVVGSRFLNEKKPNNLRMMGSRIISFFFKLTTGVKFTDPTAGMRLVNRKIMRQIAQNQNCGAEPDTWAYFVKNGARLAEVQVKMNERAAGTSYFTLGRSFFFMLRMCISIVFIQFFRKGGK